ncbi:MAG: formylglycine-generating enzyme family protein [Deltaproteobacteria bacterium]|nr:formylglycine-generating enzyme family protein [Deltaproteobacteria bacterium]
MSIVAALCPGCLFIDGLTGDTGDTPGDCPFVAGDAPGDVPAGCFFMGCAPGDNCNGDESRGRTVELSAFTIDVTEVTVADFRACVSAGSCTTPGCQYDASRDRYPVGCVNWSQADAYCRWKGGHLATEAQWEKAARGTDGRIYPWGNDEPTCERAKSAGCLPGGSVEVGGRPSGASPYGVQDLAGNVLEWTADWYGAYDANATVNPTGAPSGSHRVMRGGGWSSDARDLRVGLRNGDGPGNQYESLGFRCVRP